MTPEQQELNRKFHCAITTLNIAIPRFWTEDDEPTDASKMLEAARDAFVELHEDWRRHIGEPVTISPSVIARELRQLAAKIESEAEQ